ncbi:transposase family protein [Cytobacillus kochii]|uniref:transposase family protein n=1 Tax=Cytobacillus kochii TaxID=859143 RepID=UPI002E1D1B19|nr:transposase family protein [Cytobacillus kochii]
MNSTITLPGFEETLIKKTETRNGQYIIHFEMPITLHDCPYCGGQTKKVHDYRITKLKHVKIAERMTILFYRKRRYVCGCGKRFAEKNPIVDRFQRYSKDWNQMAKLRAVKEKTFKETAEQYGTSVSTIIRRFDRIIPQALHKKQSIPLSSPSMSLKGMQEMKSFSSSSRMGKQKIQSIFCQR